MTLQDIENKLIQTIASITHQEMIKGIRKGNTKENLNYYDTCTVPIIDNTPKEEDLTDKMAEVSVKRISFN